MSEKNDLVARLRREAKNLAASRQVAEFGPGGGNPNARPEDHVEWQAADEIERLAKEVKDHAEWARRVATDPEFAPALELVRRLTVAEKEVERLTFNYEQCECAWKQALKERDELKRMAELFAGWCDNGCGCEHNRDDGIPGPCIQCQARAFLGRK